MRIEVLKNSFAVVCVGAIWIVSLFLVNSWARSRTQSRNESLIAIGERRALKKGGEEFRSSVFDAPFITDSLLATKSLRIEVTDTYFANGSCLQTSLCDVVMSEGLTDGYYRRSPYISITIDGNAQGVTLTMLMTRPVYLEVDCPGDEKRYFCNEYNGDVFVRDFITCLWKTKSFPAGTQYEDVALWLASETKGICLKIKDKNNQIIDALNKKYQKKMGNS